MTIVPYLLLLLALVGDEYNSTAVRNGINESVLHSNATEQALICPEGTRASMKLEALRAKVNSWQGQLEGEGEPLRLKSSPDRLIYPKKLLREYKSARVVVAMLVDEQGHVADAFVVCTSDRFYDKSALEFGSRFVFVPRTINGVPVRASAFQPVDFKPIPLPADR